MSNKMKRASVSFDQSHAIDDEAKAKLKYKTLLKEFLELQKEYVSRKRKLQAAKQKRETILAEVRFLRRKRGYLLKSQSPDIEKVPVHLPNSDIESNALLGERYPGASAAALEKFDQVLVSNSHLNDEEDRGNDHVHEEDVRFTKKLKNHLIQDKGAGKRKISWPDQVTLKV